MDGFGLMLMMVMWEEGDARVLVLSCYCCQLLLEHIYILVTVDYIFPTCCSSLFNLARLEE